MPVLVCEANVSAVSGNWGSSWCHYLLGDKEQRQGMLGTAASQRSGKRAYVLHLRPASSCFRPRYSLKHDLSITMIVISR